MGRYLTVVYPVTAQSNLPTLFFTNGTQLDPVRGLVVGLLDVRQARLMMSSTTQGAATELPTAQNATYALAKPDINEWGDLAAFGGRDASNALTASLFYTTHTYDANGAAVYAWHRASTLGSPPSARENASVSFNASGDRIYVVAGRDNAQALNDARYYDLTNQKWFAVTVSSPFTARYDVGLAVTNDTLFVGGGASWGGGVGRLLRDQRRDRPDDGLRERAASGRETVAGLR